MDLSEKMERTVERSHYKQRALESFEKAEIHNVADIQRVLRYLDPNSKLNSTSSDTPISAEISASTADGRTTYKVSADTKTSTYRDMVMEGIRLIKTRGEAAERSRSVSEKRCIINGRPVVTPDVFCLDGVSYIDPIIERLLGGKRKGEYIYWELSDGYTYKYDVFQHKLTRFKTQSSPSGSGSVQKHH